MIGASIPARRSSTASPLVATASAAGAAGERRARDRCRSVTVRVGLDDRAQARAAIKPGAQSGHVALDRGEVDALRVPAARRSVLSPRQGAGQGRDHVAGDDALGAEFGGDQTAGGGVDIDGRAAASNGSMPLAR